MTSIKSHRIKDTSEYIAYGNIKARCYHTYDHKYSYYGGKGTVMCQRWKESFQAFYKDIGPRPSNKYAVIRPDSSKNYCCGKCEPCRTLGITEPTCKWILKSEKKLI